MNRPLCWSIRQAGSTGEHQDGASQAAAECPVFQSSETKKPAAIARGGPPSPTVLSVFACSFMPNRHFCHVAAQHFAELEADQGPSTLRDTVESITPQGWQSVSTIAPGDLSLGILRQWHTRDRRNASGTDTLSRRVVRRGLCAPES